MTTETPLTLEGITRFNGKLVSDSVKAAERAKALTDVTVKGLEAIEDQLSDIQVTLDALVENITYGSDQYWAAQTVDLAKFYLQDMIAQRHRNKVQLTKDDVVGLVGVAAAVAKDSVAALKAMDL